MATESLSHAGPYREEIDPASVQGFADIYGGTGAALFPTYATRFRRGEFDLLARQGIALNEILHGEQEYRYPGDLQVGDEATFETRIVEDATKRSAKGGLRIMTMETQISSARGLAVVARSTLVIRIPAAIV